MLKKKMRKNKDTLKSEVMQRIDNMDRHNNYDPYRAVRRTSIDTKELFDDSSYEDDGEELEKVELTTAEKVGMALLTVVILVVVIAGAAYMIYKF